MKAKWLIVIVAACLVATVAAIAYAASKTSAPEAIRAQRFELVNAEGDVRVVLALLAEGDLSLELYEADGRPRAMLRVLPDGTWVDLQQENVDRAAADMEALSLALELYWDDNGEFPTTEQGLDALVQRPASDRAPEDWNGPYVRYVRGRRSDPWGHDYVYRCPGTLNPAGYDLVSYGADGKPGGEGYDADIVGQIYHPDMMDRAPQ